MNPTLTTPPALEPVTLTEAKTHLRIDHADEDTLITALITAAREYCESLTRLAFISQTWTWTLDRWPSRPSRHGGPADAISAVIPALSGGSARYLEVPRGPLASVTSITTYDDADAATAWATANYFVATGQDRIYRRLGAGWPIPARTGDGIVIVYVAGYGGAASDVPEAIRRAILLMVAQLYERRLAVEEAALAPVPLGVAELLGAYKKRRV